VRIEQDEHSTAAIVNRHGLLEKLRADRLICALPFTVLRRITFSPPLSPAKQRAIDRLPYGSVTRVYLQYRRRFCLDEGGNGFADVAASGSRGH
jgi:monoamine oxidase